jgi:putative flavoprotein involved in K+ transport
MGINNVKEKTNWSTIIIGAGQAGLAAGYYLLRKRADFVIIDAGVEQVPRVVRVESGKPKLEDGRVVTVSSIVWATGFKPDFSWIDLNVADEENGWPITKRGVSPQVKGLYFIGMLFQYGLTSGLVGGVGRDAAFIVKHIHQHTNSQTMS